jgi:predicted methyltransferase
MIKLTPYQQGQLLYIHFENDLKYKTDQKTRVPNGIWRKMIDALVNNELITIDKRGVNLTQKGREYLDQHWQEIKPLS